MFEGIEICRVHTTSAGESLYTIAKQISNPAGGFAELDRKVMQLVSLNAHLPGNLLNNPDELLPAGSSVAVEGPWPDTVFPLPENPHLPLAHAQIAAPTRSAIELTKVARKALLASDVSRASHQGISSVESFIAYLSHTNNAAGAAKLNEYFGADKVHAAQSILDQKAREILTRETRMSRVEYKRFVDQTFKQVNESLNPSVQRLIQDYAYNTRKRHKAWSAHISKINGKSPSWVPGVRVDAPKSIRVPWVVGGVKALPIVNICLEVGLRIPTVLSSDEEYFHRTIARESAGALASISGGLTLSAFVYTGCNLIIGAPSVGSSLLWCGILAGGVSGAIGAGLAEQAVKQEFDAFFPTNP